MIHKNMYDLLMCTLGKPPVEYRPIQTWPLSRQRTYFVTKFPCIPLEYLSPSSPAPDNHLPFFYHRLFDFPDLCRNEKT